jgi:DNA-binding transcriptional ArsR family regulator
VADLNHLFQALADPTRRAVVERLGRSPAATSELARPFAMALPSFVQHLQVLEKAGIVTSRKEGRVRTYQLTPQPLQAAEAWMVTQRQLWERRLDQFDDYVRTLRETT